MQQAGCLQARIPKPILLFISEIGSGDHPAPVPCRGDWQGQNRAGQGRSPAAARTAAPGRRCRRVVMFAPYRKPGNQSALQVLGMFSESENK